MTQKDLIFYTYPFPENLIVHAFCLMIIGLSWTLGLFAGWVIVASSLAQGDNILADIEVLLAIVIVVGSANGLSLLLINLYPSFWISQNGLIVRTFPFGNKFVPWNDIIRISPFIFPGSQLVILNRLTIIHRLIGVFMGATFRPSFRIKRTLLNYQEAIRIIQQNIRS